VPAAWRDDVRVLIWHDLSRVLRGPAFWAAAVFYLSSLALFVVIWGDGVPIAGSGSTWEQFLRVKLALLAVVLPWTAVRSIGRTDRELTLLSLATATSPSRLVVATVVALCISLLGLALLALPLVLIMQQVTTVPMAAVIASLVPLAGLASLVAVLATVCGMLMGDSIAAWMAATIGTIAATVAMPVTTRMTIVWFVVACVLVIPLVLGANARLMYLGDGKP
jgi:hypothetical protein